MLGSCDRHCGGGQACVGYYLRSVCKFCLWIGLNLVVGETSLVE